MDFRDYLAVLRRRWPLVVAMTVLGVLAAAAYLAAVPKSYVAASVVFVTAQGADTVGDLQQGNDFSQQAVKTYAEVAKSPVVLGPVIDRLGLDDTAEELALKLDISVRLDTTVFQITSTESDPERAAQVANAVAESAIDTITTLEASDSVDGVPLVRLDQIQTATVPLEPASPKTRTVLPLGLFVGLALGFAITLIAAVLDTRIQGPSEVASITDRPLLATIPVHRRAKKNPLIVRSNPEGRSGEAFRTLRTNLRYLESTDARSVLVTSPRDGEGKSTIAANLAWSLAQSNFSVILVDTDLRSPRVGAIVQVDGTVGLTDVILGYAGLDDAIQRTDHPDLSVLLAGSEQPNPSELLGSAELATIIESLESRFDYVIIDSPPVLSYTDAAVVSVVASGTVVAVSSGRTRRGQLRAALLTLANVGVTPLGTVLNRVQPSGLDLRPGQSGSTLKRTAPAVAREAGPGRRSRDRSSVTGADNQGSDNHGPDNQGMDNEAPRADGVDHATPPTTPPA
jgi:capsular exopolysaccharide synthesis family protein